MQANAIIYTGQIVSTLIGNDILTKAISDTANTIYHLLYGLVDLQDPILDQAIDELDVKAQIKCVESIIGNLDKDRVTRSLNISLEQLHEIICRIREDLKQINQNFTRHQTKYFYYYRRIDNSQEIANLTRHKHILDQRMDMFMKIFTIDNIDSGGSCNGGGGSCNGGGGSCNGGGGGGGINNTINNNNNNNKKTNKQQLVIHDITTKTVNQPGLPKYGWKDKVE